jgi:hypothetical protein
MEATRNYYGMREPAGAAKLADARDLKTSVLSICPIIETESDGRARAWRNGIRSGLKENLSARRETGDAELLKFGETSNGNPEPSPERHQPGRCRD